MRGMIRVTGERLAAPCAAVASTQLRSAYVGQMSPELSPGLELLSAVRELALRQIDLEVLDQAPRYRTASKLIGHSSVELIYAILRAGIEGRPAERH